MKISVSNIAWTKEYDEQMYDWLQKQEVEGLEIAPTRIITDSPYSYPDKIAEFAMDIKDRYGLEISSMQSIWFGRTENMFASEQERNALIEYTRKAIVFADAAGCNNLVFGCPRNRNLPEGGNTALGEEFFKEIAEYAKSFGTVIGMEANPPIYNTNYINTTEQALELIEKIDSDGFRLNLDMGTMIANGEDVNILYGREQLINHVHISEPGLVMIEKRAIHEELARVLYETDYRGYVSLELKTQENIDEVKKAVTYLQEIFS